MKKKSKYLWLITVLFVLFFYNSSEKSETEPSAVKGILDLTNWDIDIMGSLSLKGEWEFYWNSLLSPRDFKGQNMPQKTGYFTLPHLWNDSNTGYMEYYKISRQYNVNRYGGVMNDINYVYYDEGEGGNQNLIEHQVRRIIHAEEGDKSIEFEYDTINRLVRTTENSGMYCRDGNNRLNSNTIEKCNRSSLQEKETGTPEGIRIW